MPTDTDAGDRPGTPEQYDREAAWSRFVAACAKCQTWPEGKTVFFRELDAAVAWATRVERERAAKMIDELAAKCWGELAADGYRELAKRIRSDSDTPAQENSK
jgi:hypothetical protein